MQVAIIGGGITGTAAAYELARAGTDVTVIERGSLAAMASGRTLAGVRQSARHPAEMPLAMAAVRRWEQLHEELGADLEYRQRGNLRLAEDEEDVAAIRTLVQEQRTLGLEIEYLEGTSAVREIAPALSEAILAASWCPTDGHANPIAAVRAYAAAASQSGARILEQTGVTRVLHENGRVLGVETDAGPIQADAVVVAAGIDTPLLISPLGLELSISLALVPVVQTVTTERLLDPVLGTAKAHFAARQEVDGKLRFSSGGHPVDFSPSDVSEDRMQPGCQKVVETLERGISILPALEYIPVQQVWGGLVDLTPDGVPVIDRVPEIDGLIVAAGFCGHGFCLGPVSGEIVRDLVLCQESSFDLEPFTWGRSSQQTSFAKPELLG